MPARLLQSGGVKYTCVVRLIQSTTFTAAAAAAVTRAPCIEYGDGEKTLKTHVSNPYAAENSAVLWVILCNA